MPTVNQGEIWLAAHQGRHVLALSCIAPEPQRQCSITFPVIVHQPSTPFDASVACHLLNAMLGMAQSWECDLVRCLLTADTASYDCRLLTAAGFRYSANVQTWFRQIVHERRRDVHSSAIRIYDSVHHAGFQVRRLLTEILADTLDLRGLPPRSA
ncbi:MAG: hypothetical protein KDA96_05520, partial [Planctomycetaceae bacterium]|nr:hypothetical protein [Planctomycetaceae bacterium]